MEDKKVINLKEGIISDINFTLKELLKFRKDLQVRDYIRYLDLTRNSLNTYISLTKKADLSNIEVVRTFKDKIDIELEEIEKIKKLYKEKGRDKEIIYFIKISDELTILEDKILQYLKEQTISVNENETITKTKEDENTDKEYDDSPFFIGTLMCITEKINIENKDFILKYIGCITKKDDKELTFFISRQDENNAIKYNLFDIDTIKIPIDSVINVEFLKVVSTNYNDKDAYSILNIKGNDQR